MNHSGGATVAVIGGGITGLSAAWELSSSAPPGTRIVVLEASSRLGGHLRSATVGGRVVDLGADAFLARRPEAVELCKELGIGETLVAPGGSTASVWAKGALRPLPAGLVLGVPTRFGPLARSGIVSKVGLARAALDLLVPARPADASRTQDRSVAELVGNRLGTEVSLLLAGPLVGGIHAGRADDLSAEAVFPALLEAWRKGGSLMRALRPSNGPAATTSGTRSETPHSLTGGAPGEAGGAGGAGRAGRADSVFLTPLAGMASLPATLCSALRSRGVELVMSAPVERIERIERDGRGANGAWTVTTPSMELAADALVVAVPVRAAAGLLAAVDADLARLVGDVTSASVVVVTFQLDAAAMRISLSGTGFLVPAVGGGLVTACTFLSTKWPHLAREGDVLIRASAGRSGDDRATSMADGELVEAVSGELERMIGPLGEPRQVLVTPFADAFPQYQVGHVARVAGIEVAAERLPGLALAGAAYHGVGVPACVGSGRRAARRVLPALRLSGGNR